MTDVQYTDFHLFCGAGGGALGFSWATRTYGALRGSFRSLGGGGGIWVNPDDRVGRALGWQA